MFQATFVGDWLLILSWEKLSSIERSFRFKMPSLVCVLSNSLGPKFTTRQSEI